MAWVRYTNFGFLRHRLKKFKEKALSEGYQVLGDVHSFNVYWRGHKVAYIWGKYLHIKEDSKLNEIAEKVGLRRVEDAQRKGIPRRDMRGRQMLL